MIFTKAHGASGSQAKLSFTSGWPRWNAPGKVTAVVTQNIDGLHKKAGSRNVFELHGSVYENFCMAAAGDLGWIL